jgi:hypothetical protein
MGIYCGYFRRRPLQWRQYSAKVCLSRLDLLEEKVDNLNQAVHNLNRKVHRLEQLVDANRSPIK